MDANAGRDRLLRINQVLQQSELDGLVVATPSNALMLTGYWPVVGTSVAAATREGTVHLLVPADEEDLARKGWAERVETYSPGSLGEELDPLKALGSALGPFLEGAGLARARIGYETKPLYEGSSYSATFRFDGHLPALLEKAAPQSTIRPADAAVEKLRFSLTPYEVDRVRLACRVVERAFHACRGWMREGASGTEATVASVLSSSFEQFGLAEPGVDRAGAFAWCMSGANSARAGGAFARTTGRRLEAGDLALVHANPYVDGYFGDVTRTYVMGDLTARFRTMYEAIFRARDAAFQALKPGAPCRDVDRAARSALESKGYGKYFTHGLGHSVGFSVISAEFPPRLNPASPDILEPGCTVNVEPAIYIEGFGGIRHCDVVTITDTGFELLTPFDQEIDALTVSG